MAFLRTEDVQKGIFSVALAISGGHFLEPSRPAEPGEETGTLQGQGQGRRGRVAGILRRDIS